MHAFQPAFEQIWQTYSGEAAWQTVADLSRFHRIQASPGYRQAAHLLRQRLIHDGLDVEILSFPASEQASFWAWPSFQEWDCTAATLHLIEPTEEARLLADFRAHPISLIQRSTSFQGEAEVVLLQDGEEAADYHGLEVSGKVVLTRGDLRRVRDLAVAQRGAIGILFDGMQVVKPVRPQGDLADVHQYTSFWWQANDTKCFGFVLTPRQGQSMRDLLRTADFPVRVRANVDSRLYDGTLEVVSATIPGLMDEEVIITAHLCHPLPSANDNASGVAAALEAARSLQALIASGELARPQRTIRFLWMPEMTGTCAYLSNREGSLDRIIAGLNLDMVGEDQDQTKSSWLIERPPDAAASFAPELLAWLRDRLPSLNGMTDVSPSHAGLEACLLYRQAEATFSGGSDHFVLSDPTVGVPTPMLIQWPDRFYHTSADTPERTDPQSLARAGALAAAYAYWLATAGIQEVTWLGYEVAARYKAHLIKTVQAAVTKALTEDGGEACAETLDGLDRRLAYLLDRHKAALDTLQRLAPVERLIADLQAKAERAAQRELSWARGAVDLHIASLGLESLPSLPPRSFTPEEEEAAVLFPSRQVRGPVPLTEYLCHLGEEDRQAWHHVLKEHKGEAHHTLAALALYWADGIRSVLEIANLVELESGQRNVKLLLTYFRLLEKLGFVAHQQGL